MEINIHSIKFHALLLNLSIYPIKFKCIINETQINLLLKIRKYVLKIHRYTITLEEKNVILRPSSSEELIELLYYSIESTTAISLSNY